MANRKRRVRTMRTATGRKIDPAKLEEVELEARDALRERTEEGHLAAGRTPPSLQEPTARQSGATRVIDQTIRDYWPHASGVTEDEKLLQSGGRRLDFTRTDT